MDWSPRTLIDVVSVLLQIKHLLTSVDGVIHEEFIDMVLRLQVLCFQFCGLRVPPFCRHLAAASSIHCQISWVIGCLQWPRLLMFYDQLWWWQFRNPLASYALMLTFNSKENGVIGQ